MLLQVLEALPVIVTHVIDVTK